MKHSPLTVGLLQALGLIAYVSLFTVVVQSLGNAPHFENSIFAMVVFLLAFIISASICGSIALMYPLILFFENKKKQAVQTIFWTVGWLIVAFCIIASIALAF
jgi:cell shape-determining protein MreD